MWVAARVAGLTPTESNDLQVERDTEFQLEDEASRISRITGEFLETLDLAEAVKEKIARRWLESSGIVELEELEESELRGAGNQESEEDARKAA